MSGTLSNDDKLRRLIYLSRPDDRYSAGNIEQYSLPEWEKDTTFLNEYLTKHEDFLSCISEASDGKLVPKRSTIFHVTAKLLNHPELSEKGKTAICMGVLKLCQSDEDFFDFIKYYTKLRTGKTKISTAVRKVARQFYNKKSPEQLVDSYKQYTSNHGWSHKTLIKLIHYKSDTPLKNIVINYIMFKKVNTDNNDDNHKRLIKQLESIDLLRTTKDIEVAVDIIDKLKVSYKQLTPVLLKSQQAWEAVIPQMTTQEILYCLPKLYHLGFLKANKKITASVVECLSDLERVKASNIHPIEVYIHQKNFEKGGRQVDPKLLDHLVNDKKLSEEKLAKVKETVEPKCPMVMTAIHKCMALSYNCVKSLNKKFLITIDVSERMDTPCVHNKNITSIEAALSIAMYYIKTEKEVTIATYAEKDIKLMTIHKGDHFTDTLKKLKDQKCNNVYPLGPIDWALQKQKKFDVFINFVHNCSHILNLSELSEKIRKGSEIVKKYRETLNQNAKILNFSLGSNRLGISKGDPNMIDVYGLDNEVPTLLQAFFSGKFC